MHSRQAALFAVFSVWLWSAACSRPALTPANPRVTLVQFDNQSVAAEKWVAVLISAVSAHQLQSSAEIALTLAEDAEGWRSNGSGRYISGHYRRDGEKFRIQAFLTDSQTNRQLARAEGLASEQEVPQVAGQLWTQLLGLPVQKLSSPAAWTDLAKALASQDEASLADFVQSQPGFAPAYPLLARQLIVRGQTQKAQALAQSFPAGGDPLSRAQLNFTLAASPEARLNALEALLVFRPRDPVLLADLAQSAANLRQWDQATAHFEALTRIEPSRVEWWNALGYAQANRLQLDKAVQALTEYRRLAPNDPNSIDSLGEVHYLNRRFPEAAGFFDEQARRYPAFQNGVGWRKAAFAYANASKLKEADERFEQWMRLISAQASPSAQAFQRALWLARTRRAAPAFALLEREAAGSSGERKTLAGLHAAMLRFGLEGAVPAPADWQRWGGELREGNARNELLVFALLAQPVSNPAVLRQRVAAAVPQPQMAALRQELLGAVDALTGPDPDLKSGVFPLPNAQDSVIDALLLRKRPAVLQ